MQYDEVKLLNHELEHSTNLNIDLWSDVSEADSLIAEIWKIDFQEFVYKKTPGKRPETALVDQLKVLILNLFYNWSEDPTLLLGVGMSKSSYKKVSSRYNTLKISAKIIELIKHLKIKNYIEWKKGSEAAERTTRIWPAPKLIELFEKSNLSISDIKYKEEKEVIILNKKDEDHKATKALEYKDTALIKEMRQEVKDYNDLLAVTYIDIGDISKPLLEMKNGGYIRINQLNKFVRRVFYRGEWILGGRFHGGWWQRINSDIRKKILMNDKPTIELDYSGFHVNLIYGLNKTTPPDDPYALNIEEKNFTAEALRSLIKDLVLMTINAKSRQEAFKAFRNKQETGSIEKKMKDKKLEELLNSFIKKNPEVESYLGSDKGVELMAIDGRITAKIINHFTKRNIPILTVHDSYILDHEYSGELRTVMNKAIKEEIGEYNINIKQDNIGIDQYRYFVGQVPNDTFMRTQLIKSLPQLNKIQEYNLRYEKFVNWLSSTKEGKNCKDKLYINQQREINRSILESL